MEEVVGRLSGGDIGVSSSLARGYIQKLTMSIRRSNVTVGLGLQFPSAGELWAGFACVVAQPWTIARTGTHSPI